MDLMPGQTKTRQLHFDLKQRGGFPWVLARIAGGSTVQKIAKELGVSRWLMDRWVYRQPNSAALIQEARRRGASALAEETLDIADSADPQTERLAAMQIKTRQWLAGKFAPAEFGEQKAAVNINMGDLHLLALRQVQQTTPSPIEAAQAALALPSASALPANLLTSGGDCVDAEVIEASDTWDADRPALTPQAPTPYGLTPASTDPRAFTPQVPNPYGRNPCGPNPYELNPYELNPQRGPATVQEGAGDWDFDALMASVPSEMDLMAEALEKTDAPPPAPADTGAGGPAKKGRRGRRPDIELPPDLDDLLDSVVGECE